MKVPRLIGVIHLPALPGSPRFEGDLEAITAAAGREAALLAGAGYDGVMLENFGDAPFFPREVPPIPDWVPRAVRIRDAAAALAIPRSSLYRLIKDGIVPAVRFGSQGLVILEADLRTFLAAHRTGAAS